MDLRSLGLLLHVRQPDHIWWNTVQNNTVVISYNDANALGQVVGCTVEPRYCVAFWRYEHNLT